MVQLRTHVLPVVVVALVVLVAGCPAKQPAETATGTPAGPAGSTGTSPEATPTETGAPAGEVTLTKDAVKNVMASMEDEKINGIMDGIAKELGLKDKESPEAMKQVLDKAAKSPEIDEAVKAHGFKDAAEWVETLNKVLPGMGPAMEKAMADMMGPEAAAKQPEKTGGEDEFAAMKEAFGEPSEADVAVIADVVKEQMEAEGGGAKSAP